MKLKLAVEPLSIEYGFKFILGLRMSLNPFTGMGQGVARGWIGAVLGFGSKSPVVQGLISFGTIVAIGLFVVREGYEIGVLIWENPKTQAESAISKANAALARPLAEATTGKTEAERITAEATALLAQRQAKANAEKAEAEARAAQAGADKAEAEARTAQMTACKTQAEAIVASGINTYDVTSYLDKECRALLKLQSD